MKGPEMRREQNFKKHPHKASFLLTFHSAMTQRQRMEAATAPEVESEEREALHFVSGGQVKTVEADYPSKASVDDYVASRAPRPVAPTMEVTSWSGTTIEVPDAPEFASAAQVKWMMNIAERKQLPAGATAEALFIRLRQGFAKSAASAFITKYKDLPDRPREFPTARQIEGAEAIAPGAATEEVFPAPKLSVRLDKSGKPIPQRYAVKIDGVLKFFKIKPGRKEGFYFIDVQASDEFHQIRNRSTKEAIIDAILEVGEEEAQRAYGVALGSCGRCGRTLTDATSREYGIGPKCRSL
jgi:hypothetical protein